MQVHDTRSHDSCGCCSCAECETRRTMEISPSTRQHIFGEFDVEKARAEVQREKFDRTPTNFSFNPWDT